MDDGPVGGAWTLDPDTRTALRLDRVRSSLAAGAWSEVILEAEELLDEQPDHAEALLLLGEGLQRSGDHELAREVFAHRVVLDPTSVPALVGLATSAFHMTDLPTALETARDAIRRDPGNARAHYVLGLSLERSPGRQAEAMTALTAAAHLDGVEFPLPFAATDAEWLALYARALEHLPDRVRMVWDGVPVRLEDWPDLEELRTLTPPMSPNVGALYVGSPSEGGDPFETKPSAIRLFRRNLARAGSPEAMVVDLAHLLQDEALDWLGLDLDDVDG